MVGRRPRSGRGARMTAPTVLLADDHGAIRTGLRIMLEAHGIVVVGEAADGDVAVRNASALRPDVVLMDLRMPGRDGISATREIVERGLSDVLVLTSFDEDDLVLGAIRAGAAGFLLKTVDALALAAAVRAVAGRRGRPGSASDPQGARRCRAERSRLDRADSGSGRPAGTHRSRAGDPRRHPAGLVERPARRTSAHLRRHGEDARVERAGQARCTQSLACGGARPAPRRLRLSSPVRVPRSSPRRAAVARRPRTIRRPRPGPPG